MSLSRGQNLSLKYQNDIQPGDFFEDCSFGPVLCIAIEIEEIDGHHAGYGVKGISLINGEFVRCEIPGCGPKKLTFIEAIRIRLRGPDPKRIQQLKCRPIEEWDPSYRWWEAEGMDDYREEIFEDNPSLKE